MASLLSPKTNALPSALPPNWPNSTAEELEAFGQRLVSIGYEQTYSFASNFVKTSKYEVYNFIPKFLLEEFNPRTKTANVYFLLISCLQCVPQISNTGGMPTTLIPLTVVILVDAVFQIMEDITRHRADLEANSSRTMIYDSHSYQFVEKLWSDVRVGDLIQIQNREFIPADCVIISVAEKNELQCRGQCYVDTKSLDGETNLKLRTAVSRTAPMIRSAADITALNGAVEMEHPNKLIDSFVGVMDLKSNGKHVLTQTNILLRGCMLRNTDWAIGMVVNTGHDTKIMMSSQTEKAIVKTSGLEQSATIQIQRIIIFLMLVCFGAATGQAVMDNRTHTYTYTSTTSYEIFSVTQHYIQFLWYLKWNPNAILFWFIKFFYSLLLHATFIPVSLYVSMSLVRFYQSVFMNQDLEMYYEVTDTPALVRTMTLNEELGQISHVFTDKTGTLTRNVLDFRKCCINGIKYGVGITEIGRTAWKLLNRPIPQEVLEGEAIAQANAVPHVSFYDPVFDTHYGQINTPQAVKIRDFFRVLSLCHDIIPETVTYQVDENGNRVHDSRKRTVSQNSHDHTMANDTGHANTSSHSNNNNYTTKTITAFSANSPDDEALVHAAKYFGFSFVDKEDGTMHIIDEETETRQHVQVYETLEFNSTRKRMSVIIKENPSVVDISKHTTTTNGSTPKKEYVRILCKGADSVIFPRLAAASNGNTSKSLLATQSKSMMNVMSGATSATQQKNAYKNSNDPDILEDTFKQLHIFSEEGLRCLCICQAYMDAETYSDWQSRYTQAKADISQIEKKKKGLPNLIDDLEDEIENNLELLGVTAIEDRLQDGVPECIEDLIDAGINVWVLTGDKEETAVNIAVACNLLQPPHTHMQHITINAQTADDPETMAAVFEDEMKKYETDAGDVSTPTLPRALIIDGPSLLIVLKDAAPGGLRDAMLNLTQICKSVVCCRVSPDQKKEIVTLVKDGIDDVRTLAIGDGANDVAMIQAAHIGVGISGEEGLQAVNSADYAIAQFRFLGTLVLKHGRYNYIRMGQVVCYTFYKNVLMSLAQFWFNFNCLFSGQKYYTEGAIQAFNLIFSSIPILLLGTYDMDINPKYVFAYPKLFLACINHDFFNTTVFWVWMAQAVLESVFVSVVPLYLLENSSPGGETGSFWEAGATTFTVIIIIINLKILFMQCRWYWFTIVAVLVSILSWWAIALIITNLIKIDYDWFGIFNSLLVRKNFWLTLVLMVTVILAKDAYVTGLDRNFNFKAHHILQEAEVYKEGRDSSNKGLARFLKGRKGGGGGGTKTAPAPPLSSPSSVLSEGNKDYQSILP